MSASTISSMSSTSTGNCGTTAVKKITPTPCCSKVGIKRGPWTPEEDQILVNYIEKEGEGRWRTLPKRAGLLRCGKSCRLRWMNYLRPSLKKDGISPDEEDLILRLHRLLGNRWSLIAGRIPGRTDNEIKNYWNTRISKKLIRQGLDPRTHQPLVSYPEFSSANTSYDQQTVPPYNPDPRPNPIPTIRPEPAYLEHQEKHCSTSCTGARSNEGDHMNDVGTTSSANDYMNAAAGFPDYHNSYVRVYQNHPAVLVDAESNWLVGGVNPLEDITHQGNSYLIHCNAYGEQINGYGRTMIGVSAVGNINNDVNYDQLPGGFDPGNNDTLSSYLNFLVSEQDVFQNQYQQQQQHG